MARAVIDATKGLLIDSQSGPTGQVTPLAGTSSQLTAGNGTAVTVGSGLTLAGGTLTASGGSGSVTTMYIPDPSYWESTGINAPEREGSILRIGNNLYQFGGNQSGSGSNKIYSASWVENPTFSDTGFTLPNAIASARTAIIDNTIYIFGSNNAFGSNVLHDVNIYSASLSNPLVWSDTGVDLPSRRDNAPLVVNNGLILIIKGYTGTVGTSTFLSASTSNPLSWSTTSTFGVANWECGGFATARGIFYVGGYLQQNTIGKISTAVANSLTASVETSILPTAYGVPAFCHNGNEVFMFGVPSATYCQSATVGRELAHWVIETNSLPANTNYNRGMNWVGPDGRYYLVTLTTPAQIWRSGRKAVTVSTALIASSTPYAGLPATYLDGAPAGVSPHIRMGMEPWRTNRTAAF